MSQPFLWPIIDVRFTTATTPALTVTLSANGEGSTMGASGVVGWVVGFVKTAVAFLSLWRQY